MCILHVREKRSDYHRKTDAVDEDALMEVGMEAGMEDMQVLEDFTKSTLR